MEAGREEGIVSMEMKRNDLINNYFFNKKKPAATATGFYYLLERETGFEPATLALARRCSTTELFPRLEE